MYSIYADNVLIYDSTLDDYKIGKASITREVNKADSFTFSIYPDHFYYDNFVRLSTVIKVYRSGKIIFRGRILNDTTDYWNNKVITCEGELGFLQDSIIRPFKFSGRPEELFQKFIRNHNSQVDSFKRFNIGTVTVVDANDYITRYNSAYESALSNMNSRLLENATGGYFYITHGDDGQEELPTIHYIADFVHTSTQTIEFGSNLKDFIKTVKAEDIATAIIPLGAELDDGNEETEVEEETEGDGEVDGGEETEKPRLTIADENGGIDYVYDSEAVRLYGWIFKVVEWEDVTDAKNLKKKAIEYLKNSVYQSVTLEVNAIDLHLLDPSIESINVGDYVRAVSTPHKFDYTFLCSKQTIDLLKPENDSFILGHTYKLMSETNATIQKNLDLIKKEYATKEVVAGKIKQTQSLIETSETQILTKVSEKYVTDDEFNKVISSVESSITQTADAIRLEVSGAYVTQSDFETERNRVSGELDLKIGKNDSGQIVSMLNAVANVITIKSDNFTLEADGTITATAGKIGKYEITDDGLFYELEDKLVTTYYTTERYHSYSVDSNGLSCIYKWRDEGDSDEDWFESEVLLKSGKIYTKYMYPASAQVQGQGWVKPFITIEDNRGTFELKVLEDSDGNPYLQITKS